MYTIKQALASAQQQLAKLPDASAKLEAEVLLAFTLDKPRAYLYAWPEQQLDPQQQNEFEFAVKRRSSGEPVAYITETREFWGLPLKVSPATLIPRPETERLVEIALQYIPENKPCKVADLGTGSGALALAIASERPLSEIIATDISTSALAVAKQNQQSLNLKNISFVQSRWFENLNNEQFDIVVSNPPYVADNDPHLQQGDLRFEPVQALSSGSDGLRDIREIVSKAGEFLKPEGWLLIEHGFDQGDKVIELFQQHGFQHINCYQDYGQRERATIGQLTST